MKTNFPWTVGGIVKTPKGNPMQTWGGHTLTPELGNAMYFIATVHNPSCLHYAVLLPMSKPFPRLQHFQSRSILLFVTDLKQVEKKCCHHCVSTLLTRFTQYQSYAYLAQYCVKRVSSVCPRCCLIVCHDGIKYHY